MVISNYLLKNVGIGVVEEVRRLVDGVVREFLRKVRRFKEVGSKSPHGIYIYDHVRDEWVLVQVDGGYFEPRREGYYVIYFDNTKCPACRKYDLYWFPYTKSVAGRLGGYYFIIVLCEWFAGRCRSEAASSSFTFYDIHASPTTLLLRVKGGKVVYNEKYEGVLTAEELRKVVEGFADRAEKAERGERVELPVKRGGEEELIDLLRKLLLGGG